MHRHRALAPFSSDHHLALAKAWEARLAARSGEVHAVNETYRSLRHWAASALGWHMYAEETLLVPLLSRLGAITLAERLEEEHSAIVHLLHPGIDGPSSLGRLGELLASHVRFEEDEVLPWLEEHLTAQELEVVETRLHAQQAAPPH